MEIDIKGSKGMKRQEVWLIGVQIDIEIEEPEFYFIIIPDEIDKVLLRRKKILMFNKKELCSFLLEDYNIKIENIDSGFINELDFVYKIRDVIDLVKNEGIDRQTVVIDSLNILFDVITSIDIEIPQPYKEILYDFADFLTFDTNISKGLKQVKYSSIDIIDAVYWLNGCMFSNSTFIR
ncbi:hypothetical protein CLV24_1472 [Pontibacter ummariensis]|uniref:Uncharacterized protein n=1 Tax=Pontibacter ummariensis TaxID=1610492 RepID=A0A239LMC5_9BACT|nr:hypothetical protein [Pontibacter ummariensis]PRY02749.1 hypothetical protein CLV24_1472 [Pontibacter ummariensis]SNT31052.1 hypothetical protein SAMN06296052_14413 [Pontibacter ummariensis]